MAKRKNPRVRKSSTKGWGVKGLSKPIPATILIPSGRCPYIVESTDEDDVKQWIMSITEDKPGAHTYEKSVYTYWLRHSFDVNSEDYQTAKEIVEFFVPERVKKVDDLRFEL